MQINKSLYFKDVNGKEYFLFQILNYGKKTDEIKFIFNAKNEGTGIIYSPNGSSASKEDIIKPYVEIGYHNDGHIYFKLPAYKKGDKNDYKNRFKKNPLDQIKEFTPIIKYTVISYNLCKKTNSSDIFLLENNLIFNGEPFECILYLGNLQYANPPNNQKSEIIFRVNDVAKNVDLIVWIYKSSYSGKIIKIPNTNIKILNKGNVVQIVQDMTQVAETHG